MRLHGLTVGHPQALIVGLSLCLDTFNKTDNTLGKRLQRVAKL